MHEVPHDSTDAQRHDTHVRPAQPRSRVAASATSVNDLPLHEPVSRTDPAFADIPEPPKIGARTTSTTSASRSCGYPNVGFGDARFRSAITTTCRSCAAFESRGPYSLLLSSDRSLVLPPTDDRAMPSWQHGATCSGLRSPAWARRRNDGSENEHEADK